MTMNMLLQIDVFNVETGSAVLLIGILGLLLYALVQYRNPVGMAMWAFTVVMITISALYNVGLEFVWIGILFTGLLTVIGVAARVMQQ